MATTNPAYTVPGFATSQVQQAILLNPLNFTNKDIYPSLIKKYPRNYNLVMEALGNVKMNDARVENKSFSHYEKRSPFFSVAVQSNVTATGAGVAITLTVATADHYTSGTSPVRVGEVVEVASSGIQGQITAINTSTPSAHTFTVKPLNTADEFKTAGDTKIAAGEIILFRGAVNIGEGSDKISSLVPLIDKVTNTTTEHRDDFTISDVADMERLEINGVPYYFDLALDDVNIRYMTQQFWKCMTGVSVNNITGTSGTIGVIPRVAANGTTTGYTAGSLAFSDLQAFSRALNFYGGVSEYHLVMDTYSKQAIEDLLFTKFTNQNGGVTYASVGGSKENAAFYGFDQFYLNGITFHEFTSPMFDSESMYQRTIATNYYKNFALAIPQKRNNDAQTGEMFPSYQLVYQLNKTGEKILTYETGGTAKANRTTKMERTVTLMSYPGVRVFGANQFGILKGS